MLPGGAWGESEDRKRKRLYVYCRNQKKKREEKPSTPAPVYLKSIKGYHHKIIVFPLRTKWNPRISFYFLFPYPHRLCQSILFASSQKKKSRPRKRTKRTFVTTLWSHSWRWDSERAFLRPRPSHAVPLVRAKPPLPLMPSAGTSSSGKARVERRMRNENSVCATRAQNKEKVRERRHTDTLSCASRGV